MKFKKTSPHLYILLLIIVGIISSVRAMQLQEQDPQTAMAKSSAVDYDSRSKKSSDSLRGFSYRLPITHFEPLLLFVLGTVLLSIVTGINIFRSRKVGFQVNSTNQASLGSQQKFRTRKASSKRLSEKS